MDEPTDQIDLDFISRSEFIELSNPDQVVGHSIPTRQWLSYLVDAVAPRTNDRILHIGTGSGYIPAVLSNFVKDVFTIEKSPLVAAAAADRLKNLEITNVTVITGAGEQGAEQFAPFDLVVVTTPDLQSTRQLFPQLTDSGRLFILESNHKGKEKLVCYSAGEDQRAVRFEVGYLPINTDLTQSLLCFEAVTPEILQQAKATAHREDKLLVEVVRQLIDADESEFYKRLASESGLVYRDLDDLVGDVQADFFSHFSRSFLDLLHIIPIGKYDDKLMVASFNPSVDLIDLKKLYPTYNFQLILVTLTSFNRLWAMLNLCLQGELKQLNEFKQRSFAQQEDGRNEKNLKVQAYLVSVLEAILLDAANENASDIHIEQYNGLLRLRFRVDGELHDSNHYQLSPKEILGLTNVIKIRAEMNIAEKRVPQGGRSHMLVGQIHYDLRIQVQPSLHGEYVVIRLLPQTGKVLGVNQLGLSASMAQHYQRLLRNPSGMVLVVGPTGSGKSTTLYAGLQLLANESTRKVITVEDPIEYDIHNVQQTQVKPEIGFGFADAMRSFVRLDPDVILIGEIRDHETALEALRASQTGHLVLSTLHCNDATDVQQRLFDLNALPNSVASELNAVIAQRLAKRICPECRQPAPPDPAIIKELFPKEQPTEFKSYVGTGCNHCHQRGTKGRVAVVEYLPINDEIRDAIARQVSALEMRSIALDNGLVTMRDSALAHVINGDIPLSEIPRLLSADRMAPELRGGAQSLRAI